MKVGTKNQSKKSVPGLPKYIQVLSTYSLHSTMSKYLPYSINSIPFFDWNGFSYLSSILVMRDDSNLVETKVSF